MHRRIVLAVVFLAAVLAFACSSTYRFGATAGVSTQTFTKVETGLMVSCGLKTDGHAVCWGYNFGKHYPAPTDVLTDISISRFLPRFVCGVRADGKVLCWGEKEVFPLDVPTVKVRAGGAVSCNIRPDGAASCWETNGHDNDKPGSLWATGEEVVEFRSPEGIKDAFMGPSTVICFLDNAGQVACLDFQPPPWRFSSISVGLGVICGTTTEGKLSCWGCDSFGEKRPVEPSAEEKADWFKQRINWTRELVTNDEGEPASEEEKKEFKVWTVTGREELNRIGKNPGVCEQGLEKFPSGKFLQVSVFGTTACAVRDDGTLTCWGECDNHLCEVPAGSFKHVEVGMMSACALRSDGHAVCWGVDDYLGSTPP